MSRQSIENVQRGLDLGAEDFLPKSFDPAVLREKVEKCLDKKRQRDQVS
jgi:DNA-binding response OmpR family regulator